MKRIEFKPLPAMTQLAGEQVDEGDTFELLTTYAQKPNGNWCIVEIEGVKAPGYQDNEDKDTDFGKRYQQAMEDGE